MKFKNYIETESGIKDTSTSPGTAGQILSSTVAGTSWIDQNTISSGSSEVVDIQVKNISSANGGVNLSKGDPVYIYGSVGASPRLYVDLADANSTATNNLGDSKMPCVALLDQDLAPNIEGTATVVGKLRNLITSPIDGVTPSENDTVYVKSGGGLTLIKPTGSTNLIQNVGQVGRVSTSADGNIVVAALLRSNDVPNLPEGRIWIGDGNTIVSDTVYVDEPNGRVGIRTTGTPSTNLEVSSSSNLDGIDISKTTNPTQSGALFFTTNTASEGFMFRNTNGTFQINSGGIPNSASGTSRISIIGSSGNVGIGTTSPGTYKLAVAGSTAIGGNVEVSDGIPGDRVLTLQTNNGHFSIGDIDGLGDQAFISGDSSSIEISINQSTSLYCDSNNRVGINETIPTQRLHVSGNARVTGAYYDSNNNPGTSGQILSSTVTGTDWIDGSAIPGVPAGSGTTNYLARWTPDASTLGIGVTYDNGTNVGIGTTSLTIISSTSRTLSLGSTSTTTSGGIAFQANGVVKAYNYVANNYLINQTVAGVGQTFYGAGSEQMRIHNTTGVVGIGTITPGTNAPAGTKLHVIGEIHSSTFVSAVNGLGVYSTSMGSGRGLSLYGGAQLYPQYGMLFATTSDLGNHGGVTADFATYMTMTGAGRGWVWKSGFVNSTSGNVASINVLGALTLNSTATATNFILSSDETLKDNIKEIDVKHVDVDWKNFELKSEPGIKRAGVIAQELEVKHPEFVRTASDGIKSVAYIDLLITKIAELEARLEKAGL